MEVEQLGEDGERPHFGWEPTRMRIVKKCGEEVLQCVPDSTDTYQLRVNLERDLAWDSGKVCGEWACYILTSADET